MEVRNVKRFGGILFILVVKLHLLNEVCISAFFVFLFLGLAFWLRQHSSTSSRVIGGSVEKPSGMNSRGGVSPPCHWMALMAANKGSTGHQSKHIPSVNGREVPHIADWAEANNGTIRL